MTPTTSMQQPPVPSMRQAVQEAVEEALKVLEARDLVYFDIGATQWVCNIPAKASIRTCFGEVKMMVMRSSDGVLLCMHSSGGTAYLTSANIGIDATGCFVESSLLPVPAKQLSSREDDTTNGEADDDMINGAAIGTTLHQPRRVDLRGCYVEHSDMIRASRGLAGNIFVTVLSLSGNQLQDSSISLLSDALLHNGVLVELNLSYNEISSLGSTLLATALAYHSSLKLLDLMHNRIGCDGILPWLGRTLRSNRILQELRLTHNDIGDRKGSELVTALASKPKTEAEQIKTAIVRRRTVATGAPTAAIAAHKTPPSFIAAGTRGSGRGDEPFNTTLTMLLLGNTGISDDAAHHLRHVLAENRTLTHLDISSNAFSDTGHESIALGLAGNHSLKNFNYNENHVDHEAAGVALLRALRQHPALETALFQDCVRGSSVAVAAAEWLRATKTLRTLDLSHCLLEPPGVVDFYRAIGQNTTLLNLEMTCMGIKSDQAVSILSKAIEAHTALRFLNLSYNEITLRGCKMLRDAAARHGARLMMSLGRKETSGGTNHGRVTTRTSTYTEYELIENPPNPYLSRVNLVGTVTIAIAINPVGEKSERVKMEQYLLQLPKRIAEEVRAAIASSDDRKVEMIAGADNKHFKLIVNGKEYSSKIAQLPTIIETHKTYDDNFLYKSGEIGQIFVVADKEEERKQLEQLEELPNGITPPNTNVVKRKYEKTRRYTPFPKAEVARVEVDLFKMIQGGPYEEVHEELVDFCEWMVDEDHPNGITVTDELELVRKHPEYLDLASDMPARPVKLTAAGGDGLSVINTPIATDIGSEGESQGGLESAQRSPAFAPTPNSGMSDDDDFENDLLREMEEKPSAPAPPKKSHLEDPAYHQLLTKRDRLLKTLRDSDRSIADYAMNLQANSNIVIKNRIKQMMDTAQTQRDDVAAQLEKVEAEIKEMES